MSFKGDHTERLRVLKDELVRRVLRWETAKWWALRRLRLRGVKLAAADYRIAKAEHDAYFSPERVAERMKTDGRL